MLTELRYRIACALSPQLKREARMSHELIQNYLQAYRWLAEYSLACDVLVWVFQSAADFLRPLHARALHEYSGDISRFRDHLRRRYPLHEREALMSKLRDLTLELEKLKEQLRVEPQRIAENADAQSAVEGTARQSPAQAD